MLENTLKLARWAREEINHVEGLYAFGKELIGTHGCFDFDETKLGVNIKRLGITGYQAEELLRRDYNIQIELADFNNILAIMSLGDIYEDIEALVNALKDMALKRGISDAVRTPAMPGQPKVTATPREAFFSPKKSISLNESAGEISGEMVMAYPPGIPVICMGETITEDIIDYIKMLKEQNCELQGTHDPHVDSIRVLEGSKNHDTNPSSI